MGRDGMRALLALCTLKSVLIVLLKLLLIVYSPQTLNGLPTLRIFSLSYGLSHHFPEGSGQACLCCAKWDALRPLLLPYRLFAGQKILHVLWQSRYLLWQLSEGGCHISHDVRICHITTCAFWHHLTYLQIFQHFRHFFMKKMLLFSSRYEEL